MRTPLCATLAVIMLHVTLQRAWSKQQAPLQQIQAKLGYTGEILSVISQTAMNKRSLVRPTRQTLGSCSQADIQNSIGNYPEDCVERLLRIDFDAIIAGDIGEYENFANELCSQRCGQPLVDLSFDCDVPEGAAALVYTCRVNENGDTCGRILQATIDAATPAETACLPRSTSCSNTCQTSLQTFRDTAGCCGNLTEVGSAMGLDIEIDDFTLWNSCGVPLTGLCTRGPLNSANLLVVTKVAAIGLAILALVVLLL